MTIHEQFEAAAQARLDETFGGVPFRKYGRSFVGADCVGIVALWLQQAMQSPIQMPEQNVDTKPDQAELETLIDKCSTGWGETPSSRGDVLFFRHKPTGKITHVAVALGGGRILHSTGNSSRIDNNLKLLYRLNLSLVGSIPAKDTARLQRALAVAEIGYIGIATIIAVLIIVSVGSYYASAALTPKPKVGARRNQKGAYSYDSQFTQISSELPLPDILGRVHIAGNAIYTTLQDKTEDISTPANVKMNRMVVYSSAPAEGIDWEGFNIRVNGLHYDNRWFYKQTQQSIERHGWAINPLQTKAEAVDGDIDTGLTAPITGDPVPYTNQPSLSLYTGDHGVDVPVDIRASYDRNMPVYGLSGCCYIVARFINSNKMGSFNISATISGRKCREFDENGFTTSTEVDEPFTWADPVTDAVAERRLKLAFDDISSITATVVVDGTPWTEMSATHQTGDIFSLNRLKGYIEFPDNLPADGDAITITYAHYNRSWTQNPATQLVYLLTDKRCGKGFDPSKMDWDRAVELRDYCAEQILWNSAQESVIAPRFTCNYILDTRAPLQDHVQKIVDTFSGWLFLSGGKIVMKARKPESSVFTFTESNILKDSFGSEIIDRVERANRVRVFFRTSDSYNTETEVARDDQADQRDREPRIGNGGVVEESLQMPSIESVGQAERFAETSKRENLKVNRICEFRTTLKGLALEPGDVITVTHSADPAWTARDARIEDIDHDDEDRLVLRCSEYQPDVYI